MLVTISSGKTLVFQWDMTEDQLMSLNEYANTLVEPACLKCGRAIPSEHSSDDGILEACDWQDEQAYLKDQS